MQGGESIIPVPSAQNVIGQLLTLAPAWPLCGETPEQAGGGYRRPTEEAAHERYWQPNPRKRLVMLVCDCDRADPIIRVFNGHAPPPTAVVWNDASGRAHALYILTSPVSFGPTSSRKAQEWAEVVWAGLEEALQADGAYTGLLSRGPLHSGHTLEAISGRSYELSELAAGLKLPKRATLAERLEAQHADSRNTAVFDQVRYAGYARARWSEAALLDYLICLAKEKNSAFADHPSGPMTDREALGIARSVWRFVVANREQLARSTRSRTHSRDRDELDPEEARAQMQAGQAAGAATRREQTRAELRAAVVTLTAQGQRINSQTLSLVTGLPRKTVCAHSDIWA